MNKEDEYKFLRSRISDIRRSIQENPKQGKYLREDLSILEEDLKMLESSKFLRTANRKIRQYLQVKNQQPLKTTIKTPKQK